MWVAYHLPTEASSHLLVIISWKQAILFYKQKQTFDLYSKPEVFILFIFGGLSFLTDSQNIGILSKDILSCK